MRLTPTQQRLYDLLLDGYPHSRDELISLLDDEFNERPEDCVYAHLSNMRKQLGPHGQDIVTRGINGKSTYRLVRHITRGE